MITVRLMREEDADAIRDIDALAFWTWERQVKGETAQRYRRTRTNVLASLEKDPPGCFIAEEDARSPYGNRVVGFIFSRTWGGVGWFGTFAVLPEYQGHGIGQQLISASLEYLRQDPGRVMGLETMPESPYNLGLYLRRGFQARFPTLLLSKTLEPCTMEETGLSHWSSADARTHERWLADLREATGRIQPRLDYSKEVISNARHGLGETLVLTDGAGAIGMSVVGLVSTIEGWSSERASVQVLALHPDYTEDDTLRAMLSATEALTRLHDKRVVTLPVNASHTWALERLLQWGYQIERMAVHMVLPGTDNGPVTDGYVNLARWAG
ncbi:MAG TPA: N-acetyltransferase [Anaerolineae bacterium]|nr:N-acetyltransferase [Anaerolineae bacterium]